MLEAKSTLGVFISSLLQLSMWVRWAPFIVNDSSDHLKLSAILWDESLPRSTRFFPVIQQRENAFIHFSFYFAEDAFSPKKRPQLL